MMYARHTVLAALLAAGGFAASVRGDVTARADARVDWTTFTATWLETGLPAAWRIEYAYASSGAAWTGWPSMYNWQHDHDAPFIAAVDSAAGGATGRSQATRFEVMSSAAASGPSEGPSVPPYAGMSQSRALMAIVVEHQPANRMLQFRWDYSMSLAVATVQPQDQASAMVGVSFEMLTPRGQVQLAALGSAMGGGPGDRRHENAGTQWVTTWTSYEAHEVRYFLSTSSEVRISIPASGPTLLLLAGGACMIARRVRGR